MDSGKDGSGAPSPSASTSATATPSTSAAATTTASATAAAKPVTEVREEPPAPTPSEAAPADSSRTLGPGSQGPEVVRLQQLLHGQGKTYVSDTGVYDKRTERAVRDIQQERGITGDPAGVYGPATRAALDPS